MRTAFVAIWYDPEKVKAKAIAAGWNPASGDGFLDIYMPEEDPKGHEEKEFSTLNPAVAFLQKIVSDGNDFWGQTQVKEYEVDGGRCKYCTCHGWNCIRTYTVEENGIVETINDTNCLDDED